MDVFMPAVLGGLVAAGLLISRRDAIRRRRVNTVLAAAAHEAKMRRHEHITIEHVMLSLSFDEEIEPLLATKGIDAERLRDGLVDELGRVVQAERLEGTPLIDSRVERIIDFASQRRSHPTARALFDAIVDGPDSRARALLLETDTPRSTSEAVADASGPYRSPPRRRTTAIRYWNDRRTPAAFVIGSLVEVVGLEPSRACYLTYRVHFERSFVVAACETGEAEDTAARIVKAARENGFPLRVTTETVS